MRHTITATLTAAVLLGLAGPAAALDLVPNGKFDTSLVEWGGCCGSTGTLAPDPALDAGGSELSGSARLTHDTSVVGGETSIFLTRCFSGPAVHAGAQFFLGARIRFGDAETAQGTAQLSLEFRPDTACQQASLAGTAFDTAPTSTTPRGVWTALAIGSQSAGAVAPAGTGSMRIGVAVFKKAGGTLTMNVDDVFLAPIGTPVCDGMPASLAGTPDSDFINGTEGSDVIVGRGSIDWLDGKGGNDRICGGPGADVLYGGTGDDRLFGEGGADTILGADDDDLLRGDGGNDELYGGDGKDRLVGGTGVDRCDPEEGPSGPIKSCEE